MAEETQDQGLMADVNVDAVSEYDPNDEAITTLTQDEVDMIERLVWGEAGNQDEEGRNAVRGVIFNRLASDRFPDTVEEVINQRGQFEPISKYGGVANIPIPADVLESQKYEMDAYLNVGEDASQGSTFFLNKDVARSRGTDFSGSGALVIGDHTFYKGYPGQVPVAVEPNSHNISIVDSRPGTVEQVANGSVAPAATNETTTTEPDQEAAAEGGGASFSSLVEPVSVSSSPSPRLSADAASSASDFTTRNRSGIDVQTSEAFQAGTPGRVNAQTGRVETGILQSVRAALGLADGGIIEKEKVEGDGSVLMPYEPTLREKAKYAISGFLQDKFGMENYDANRLSQSFTGNPNATDDSYGVGLADFTPAGLVFGAEEAADNFERAKNTGDKVGMGLAVVEGGLSAAEAFPLTKGLAKGAKKGLDTLADVAANMDPNTVGSLGGNAFSTKKMATEQATPDSVETLAEEVFTSPKATNMNYNNTVTAYKLFRVDPNRPGELFPLYVDAKTGIKPNVWTEATSGEIDPKTGKVKSSIGNLAYRPGWHAGDLPLATHIGPTHKITAEQAAKLEADGANNVFSKKNGKTGEVEYFERLRAEDTVWAEVEMPAGEDWQSVADSNARIMKNGKPEAKTAHITDQIPFGGFYRYKTNPNMTGEWLISGNMKVNRVLDDAEVASINQAAGVYGDMPRTPYSQAQDTPTAGTPDAGPAQAVLDIRNAQMQLATKDRIQPSGSDPLFDLSPESYEKTLPDQKETYVPRQPAGTNKPLPKGDRGRAVQDKADQIADRLAERMEPWLGTEAQYFYHTGPIVDKAMGMGFSKEEVYDWMKDFSEAYAATSPRTETAQNIRNATLVMTKRQLGIDLDEIIGPGGDGINEKGYPMMIGKSGIHRKLTDDVAAGGINPDTNPKPATFAENVYGNLDGVTVDTHAIRGALDAMNQIEPGSIPSGYIKKEFRDQYAADPSSLDPAKMIDDTMGSQKIAGQDMQTEYAVFSDIYRKAGEKLGVSPAEAQSMGWFGSGDSTGLASELKSVSRLLDERLDVTAQALGEDKESVFRKLLNKEIPVLQLFGAVGAGGAAAVGSMDDQMQQFSKGGLTEGEAKKGIRTYEGEEMADKVFKFDYAKADLNDDGELSAYEKARGEAVQKALHEEDGIMKAAHGGMACGCGGDCDGSCMEGSMPGMVVGMDPVSGNEIPLGSTAENVRDDIPAMLSEGEYVLPADVVKWHGLKHISGMMMEAKAGLMSLQAMGQIHEVEEILYEEGEYEDAEYSEEVIECPQCGGEGCDHCDGLGYHEEGEASYETPEGNEVDIAEVITEEEYAEDDEEDDAVETLSYAMNSTPKIAFIR